MIEIFKKHDIIFFSIGVFAMGVKAHILQVELMGVLDRSEEGYKKFLIELLAEDEIAIENFIKRHKKGMLWWKRDFTKEEAKSKMVWRYQWSFYESAKVEEHIEEIQKLKNKLKSEKLYDIVLSDKELDLLKDYL